MILLECPNCGPRNASEFRYGGEARPRPDVNTASETEWNRYLHMRDNPLGEIREWWYHRAGCGCWLIAERHTKTQEILRTYRYEEPTS